MAKKVKEQDTDEPEIEEGPKLEPISPAKRRRLQTAFEHGSKKGSTGDFEYAHAMFAQCVVGDPANVIYLQSLLTNLIKKYNNDKKRVKRPGAKAKGDLKKALTKKNWGDAFKPGMECLKQNPWDSGVLTQLATACGELELDECQLIYLKLALEGNPKDVALNRKTAETLENLGEFDQAIRCLERIIMVKKDDDGLRRKINDLSIQKTIHKGGYEEADTSLDVSVDKRNRESQATQQVEEITPEQKMRREIRRHPEEVTTYQNLADHYVKEEEFKQAIEVMKEAVEGTGKSLKAVEYLQDIEIMYTKRQLAVAERRARAEAKENDGKPAKEKTVKAQKLFKKMKAELNQRELLLFADRCERNPSLYSLKFEFGIRLKRAGKFNEAINQFQEARNEPRKIGESNLEIGECFQQIKQYKLAMKAYAESIETCGQWDEEVKRLALYRAGWLAKGLKDYSVAEKYLEELASVDFGYKDVAKLLDEVTKMRGKGE